MPNHIRQPTRRGFLASMAGLGVAGITGLPIPRIAARSRPRPAATLTNRQTAGQRVISSYPGLTPPSSLFNDISNGLTAGVIFFGENISSEAQIAGVISQLRQAQAQSPVQAPLLLMTDQEGGLVRRLPGDPVLSEKQVGQSADPVAAATSAGAGAGRNLAGVGMNVNALANALANGQLDPHRLQRRGQPGDRPARRAVLTTSWSRAGLLTGARSGGVDEEDDLRQRLVSEYRRQHVLS